MENKNNGCVNTEYDIKTRFTVSADKFREITACKVIQWCMDKELDFSCGIETDEDIKDHIQSLVDDFIKET